MIAAADFAPRLNLEWVIAALEQIPEDQWQTDTVRTERIDGRITNCVFGHVFDLGGGDELVEPGNPRYRAASGGDMLWNWFEDEIATTYMLYPVNDGENPDYPQTTPKARVLAYLRAALAGDEPTTAQLMEQDFLRCQRYETFLSAISQAA